MPFGISGAHRSGKTTLARELSVMLGIHFEETKTSDVMRAKGFDMTGAMTIERRVEAQEILLDHHIELLGKLPRPVILDRTPLDMAAYMLGEVTMLNTDHVLGCRIQKYVDKAMKATTDHYDTIFVVRPLPLYVIEDGKPPDNPAYQWAFQMLLEGSLWTLAGDLNAMVLPYDNHQARIRQIASDITKRLSVYEKARESLRFN